MEFWDWVRLIWVLLWRFHTGHHMDGTHRQHSRGSVLPRYSNYFWNRYSRKKRAFIRNMCWLFAVGTVYGAVVDWGATRYALLAVAPFVFSRVVMKVVNALTMVTKFTDSDGIEGTYRVMRPKVMRNIRRLKPAKIRISLPDNGPVPSEYQRAVMAENAEEHGEPILNMRFAKEVEANGNGTNNRNRYRRSSRRVGKS